MERQKAKQQKQTEEQRKRKRGRPEKPLKIDDTPENIARALFGMPSTKFTRKKS